jgi:large subunit ribosomal protein L13
VDTLSYKTLSSYKESADKTWVVIDAENAVLGRLCTQIAMRLRGKHKPDFTPQADCGDNVIVINAEKVRLTGKKWDQKEYITYTGYPGGQRFASPETMNTKKPGAMVEIAVKGMLPKTRLGRAQMGNLFVYAGSEHPHTAQKPTEIKL